MFYNVSVKDWDKYTGSLSNIEIIIISLLLHNKAKGRTLWLTPGRFALRRNTMRTEREKGHRGVWEKNRRRILQTQGVCGICGLPVDKSLRSPHPMSATVDHIIPVSKGGHPTDLDNLQLAHRCCNRQKWDKLTARRAEDKEDIVLSNRLLPNLFDWSQKPPKPMRREV